MLKSIELALFVGFEIGSLLCLSYESSCCLVVAFCSGFVLGVSHFDGILLLSHLLASPFVSFGSFGVRF